MRNEDIFHYEWVNEDVNEDMNDKKQEKVVVMNEENPTNWPLEEADKNSSY